MSLGGGGRMEVGRLGDVGVEILIVGWRGR